MKRYIIVFGAILLALTLKINAKESSNTLGEPIPMEATAYYEGEITANQTKVRTGICAAKKEWLGLTAIVYERNGDKIGDLIGIYEIQDTGSDYRIKNGTCIDIYIPDESKCWEFGRRKVLVQIIDAKG